MPFIFIFYHSLFLIIIVIALFEIFFIELSFIIFVLFKLRIVAELSVCFGVIGVGGCGSFVIVRWRLLIFFIFITNFSFILRYFWLFPVEDSCPILFD